MAAHSPKITVVVVLRLLDEERLLRQSLPGYAAYRNEVRYRLVSHLWWLWGMSLLETATPKTERPDFRPAKL